MTNNRTETKEFKQEFLRMASYIDCLLECSDTQKETLINFIARLSEYMPWYEDDDFDIEEHAPERTETHLCDYGRKETHGDVIYRDDAVEACMKYYNGQGYIWTCMLDDINKLPSAEPEIIRCRDCEHWDESWTNDWEPNCHYCPMIDRVCGENWYCAGAERRTDEETDIS